MAHTAKPKNVMLFVVTAVCAVFQAFFSFFALICIGIRKLLQDAG